MGSSLRNDLYAFQILQIPAAPIALIDFSSAKSKKKKKKMDDAITGKSTEQAKAEKTGQCPRVKRGSETLSNPTNYS